MFNKEWSMTHYITLWGSSYIITFPRQINNSVNHTWGTQKKSIPPPCTQSVFNDEMKL